MIPQTREPNRSKPSGVFPIECKTFWVPAPAASHRGVSGLNKGKRCAVQKPRRETASHPTYGQAGEKLNTFDGSAPEHLAGGEAPRSLQPASSPGTYIRPSPGLRAQCPSGQERGASDIRGRALAKQRSAAAEEARCAGCVAGGCAPIRRPPCQTPQCSPGT